MKVDTNTWRNKKGSLIMKKVLVLILFVMAIVSASHYIHGTSIPQLSDEMMEMICIEEEI